MTSCIEHFAHQLVKSETSLLNLDLKPPELNFLALDVLVELSIPTANSHHHGVHLQVGSHDSRSEHVLAFFNHLDGHANVELLDQLCQPLVTGITLLGLVVDGLREQVLSALRDDGAVAALIREQES